MTSSDNQMRVVLIGKTGNGKSALGNSLLHSRSAFQSSQSGTSITKDCSSSTYQFTDASGYRKTLLVADTPGFFDTNGTMTNDSVERKIGSQIFEMSAPGVHAFLIVLVIGRFTPEEQETVNIIKRIFGTEAEKYCILVFTNEDRLDEGQKLKHFIDSSPALKRLVQVCDDRVFSINNKLSGQQLEKKTDELIGMIDKMVRNNNGRYYTNAQYQSIAQKRLEEKRKQEEAERKKKQAEENAIVARVKAEEKKKQEELERQFKEKLKIANERAESARRLSSASSLSSGHECPGSGHGGSGVIAFLRDLNGGGSGGGGMYPQPSYPPSMPFSSMGPVSSGRSSAAHEGRFTGDYMATNGSANGRAIYEGARGGQYYMTSGGNKRYI